MTATIATVVVALIVSIISPVIINRLGARDRRQEKKEDWARQDLVTQRLEESNERVRRRAEAAAEKVEEAAEKVEAVREQAETAATLLQDATGVVAEKVESVRQQAKTAALLLHDATEEVATKVELVRTQAEHAAELLVESNGKLDQIHTLVNSNLTAAMEATVEAMRGQLTVMKRQPSEQMTKEDIDAIEDVTRRIKAQEETLAERKKQTEVGQVQAKGRKR